MPPAFQIQIDDPQEYHVGGSALTGKLLLVVSSSHALSLKEMVLRVICEVETSVETQMEGSGKLKIMKGSMRLYDGEMNLPLPAKHFAPGRHEIPFKFPLPADRPRLPPTATDVVQPTTYGHITFRLKAHARKGTSSWFSSGEIKAAEPFMFMPPSTLTDEHNNAPAMRQQVMTGYVGGAASESAQSNGFWSRLTGAGSKRRKEPPLEVQCYLHEPTTGLAQDRPTRFQLRIVSSNPQEPIMVQSVSLTLETIVTLVANGARISGRRAAQPLVQAKVLRSGAEVDVSDLLSAVEVRTTVLPTFQTPLVSFNYALVVQVSLVRAHHHRGESANIVQRLPVRVLSPYIVESRPSIAASPASADSSLDKTGASTGASAAYAPEKTGSTEYAPEKPVRVASDPEPAPPRPLRKPVQTPVGGHEPTPGRAYSGSYSGAARPEKQGLASTSTSPTTNTPLSPAAASAASPYGTATGVPAAGTSTHVPAGGAPGVPAVPGVPGVAGIPAVPAVPGVSSVLGAAGTPAVPGMPGAPGIPAVPAVPGVPTAPAASAASAHATPASSAPATPAVPTAAEEPHPSEPPPAYYE